MPRNRSRLFSNRTRWPWPWLISLALLLILLSLPASIREAHWRSPLASVASMIQKPAQWCDALREYWVEHRTTQQQLHQRLQKLSQENAQLKHLATQYEQLKQQYDALWPDQANRQLLDRPLYLAAVKQFNAWQQPHKLTLALASNHVLTEGLGVIGSQGIVGLVQRTTEQEAHVLLITDPRLGIPVKNQRTGYRSLANGNGQHRLVVSHVPEGTDVQADDLWVTSGDGQRFPANVPVAKTTRVTLNPKSPFLDIQATPVESLTTLQWGWIVHD